MNPHPKIDKKLDASGLMCPEPVFRARQCLATMEAGQVLEVVADDPLAELDLAVFCERTGHEMLACDRFGSCWKFLLCKTDP